MILQPKDTTVAYRCPVCGVTVFSVVGALALSGDMIKLKCTCGCSELVMQKADEEKLRLTVPCIFCPTPHHYLVSRKLLMTRELFTFPCAYAGIDILFVGSKGAVLKAVELSDNELHSIIDETELSGVHDANEGDNLYGDEHIRDMILFVLGDLAEDRKTETKKAMDKYVCITCGWVYDPEEGDPEGGIAPGTAFEDIPEDWTCPACGVGKEFFEKV